MGCRVFMPSTSVGGHCVSWKIAVSTFGPTDRADSQPSMGGEFPVEDRPDSSPYSCLRCGPSAPLSYPRSGTTRADQCSLRGAVTRGIGKVTGEKSPAYLSNVPPSSGCHDTTGTLPGSGFLEFGSCEADCTLAVAVMEAYERWERCVGRSPCQVGI